MPSTSRSVAVHPGRGGAGPTGAETQPTGVGRRQGLGVQEWHDGSGYEGEFVNGLKHGKGKYTWTNGENYEGSFYKDYRHGDGQYCWPTGHKFTGKFYLNRKEGYGHQLFPDGATFEGLYRNDQRFGPGVMSYPDGCKDVGLWLGDRLLKLCASVEEAFSLKNFPEYAAYMDPAAATNSLTQPPTSSLGTEARTDSKVAMDSDLLSDEDFILPPGIESYSTNGDHLPLPPGRRRELDQRFYGELWEPDTHTYQGYERDPLSPLPLQARMQAHIYKHRLQVKNVGWDVEAVLSLNREGFGPKGPLEINSELLIQHASRGELQAVSQILQTGLVHPDVADSQGHTALIAATVNCHNDVIQLLLDMGADIDKLNCEGMSALAVCHVLYYPFQSLHPTFTEPSAKSQDLRSPFGHGNSPQVSQVNNRPQTANTALSSQTNWSRLSDQSAEEPAGSILCRSSKVSRDSELIGESWPDVNEPETLSETERLQGEEREDKEGEARKGDCKEGEGQVKERETRNRREELETGSGCDRTSENGESEIKGKGREFKQLEEDVDPGERGETESGKENTEVSEQDEEDVENNVRNIHREDTKEREETGSERVAGLERSISVLDGHIVLGSVQWKDCRAKGRDKGQTPKSTFGSACSVSSYNIQVTEEVMQRSAEALSRTGLPQSPDTQETVRKMAAMKTEHRARLNTLKLLLERGADPNVSRVPMPVLFLAIMAADTEAVRRLLLCGAHTDIPLPPEREGLYPLHVAAALPGPAGPRITELLLHSVTDPDARACDHNEIFEPDKIFMKDQEALNKPESPRLKEGGRTALHVACQRDSDYQNASKVVALLLSHRASTDLLWSGHSPLSLAIATGNDLAVEELLNGGADPNIPLGRRVGSALCALANINYHLGSNRTKLLEMLAKAGVDIMMPVTVGDVVGTAVDYAYYSFSQDVNIAKTPFHALNMRERETFRARRQLLKMMGELLRETAGRREWENSDRERQGSSSTERIVYPGKGAISLLPPITEKHRKPEFKFCYQCGRSVSVKLTACSRCHRVFYCSRTCKVKAWDKRHKEECVRVSASADGTQKRVVFKSQKGPRPLSAILKSRTLLESWSVKTQRVPEPLSAAEKVLQGQVNLKENYSCN